MTKNVIKKFVEEDYKDCAILVTCDNEHKFWHNSKKNPPIIWDWDNDCFIALETNNEAIDQNKHPFTITTVALDEIQFLTASVDIATVLGFVKENITDEEQKEVTMELIKKCKPAMMGPRTLKKTLSDDEYKL
jgi:hypothetical protein